MKGGPERYQLPQFIFWGLVSVFNHHNTLVSGGHTAALWKERIHHSKDVKLNMLAPAVNNPNTAAVMVTLEFEQLEKPCIFPSTQKKSREEYFRLLHTLRHHLHEQRLCPALSVHSI